MTLSGQPRVGYVDPKALIGPHWLVWRGLLEPTKLDDINATVSIPLVPRRWEKLVVGHCTVIPERAQRRLGAHAAPDQGMGQSWTGAPV